MATLAASTTATAPTASTVSSSNTSTLALPGTGAGTVLFPQTVTVFDTNPPTSTVTGSIESIPTTYMTQPATNTLPIGSILTGSCTTPYFADVSDGAGVVLRYPQVGCSPHHQNCCPFTFQANVSLAKCPEDHSSVARGSYTACCPSHYDLLYTGVGIQTPCYSNLSTYLVPQSSTPPNYWLVTQYAYARSYQLIPLPEKTEPSLSGGNIAGIVLGVLGAVSLIIGILLWRFIARRRRIKAALDQPPDSANENVRDSTPGVVSEDAKSPVPWPPTAHQPVSGVPGGPPDYTADDRDLWPLPLMPTEPAQLDDLGVHPAHRNREREEEMIRVAVEEALRAGTPVSAFASRRSYTAGVAGSPGLSSLQTTPTYQYAPRHPAEARHSTSGVAAPSVFTPAEKI